MTAQNKVDTRLLRRVAALLIRADADARTIRLPHVLDPVFHAIRRARGRVDLLRNIEAVASGRRRLMAGSRHSTGPHSPIKDRRSPRALVVGTRQGTAGH
jgi:hypothetical protein